MKKQIVNVSMMQSAKVAAVLYLVISIPIVLIMALGMMFSGGIGTFFGSIFLIVLMPVLYAVFGFVFTLIGAFVYNLVAAKIGGIEYTTTEVA